MPAVEIHREIMPAEGIQREIMHYRSVHRCEIMLQNGRVMTQPSSSLIREGPYFAWNNDKKKLNICLRLSQVKFASNLQKRAF